MNEQIKQLALQAGAVFEKTNGLNDCPQDSLVGDEIEKFAELIVKACAKVADIADENKCEWIGGNILTHFGVKE